MDKDTLKEEIKKRKKDEWIEAWFSIEAMAIEQGVVEKALAKHIEKMSHLKEAFVFEQEFKAVTAVKNPIKGVENAFSQVANVKLFAKNLPVLLNIVLTYGPSSIEIIGPGKTSISAADMQDISNVLAGLVHQFAAAGVGGILITPEEKR